MEEIHRAKHGEREQSFHALSQSVLLSLDHHVFIKLEAH